MTVRSGVTVLGLLLCVCIAAGCPAPYPRAYEQQSRADVVMHFSSWNAFEILAPTDTLVTRLGGARDLPLPTTRAEFLRQMKHYNRRGRNLVVVIFSPALRGTPGLRGEYIVELENLFKHYGFQHISFQQEGAVDRGGRVILTETWM